MNYERPVSPLGFLREHLKEKSSILIADEWRHIGWEAVEHLRPDDYISILREEGKQLRYNICAALRKARTEMSPSSFNSVGLNRSVSSSNMSTSSMSTTMDTGEDFDGESSPEYENEHARERVLLKAKMSTTLPAAENYETDAEGYYIFDPTKEIHIREFVPGNFNPKQKLDSPPGVRPDASGSAKTNTNQAVFNRIARTFKPMGIWGFDAVGAGAEVHRNTDHYNKYVCDVWMAGGGPLEYVIKRYKDRYFQFQGQVMWQTFNSLSLCTGTKSIRSDFGNIVKKNAGQRRGRGLGGALRIQVGSIHPAPSPKKLRHQAKGFSTWTTSILRMQRKRKMKVRSRQGGTW